MKKILCLVLMTVAVMVTFTGCKQLMQQEEIDSAKTVGQSVYTGFSDIYGDQTDSQVIAQGGLVCDRAKLTGGEDNWNKFMEQVGENTPCSIRIKQKTGGTDTIYRDLYYNGSRYRLIISTNPEQYDYTFDYLYDLSGRKNKRCRQSRIVFLSNTKDASFEDIIGSIGVNEKDRKMDYQLIFRHQ